MGQQRKSFSGALQHAVTLLSMLKNVHKSMKNYYRIG